MKYLHSSKQLDQVAAVLSPLHDLAMEAGVLVFVGGGAIRDTHFGRPYNDIDVYILRGDDCEGLQQAFMDEIEKLPGSYEVEKVYGREDSDYTVAFEGEEDRFDKIWKFRSNDGLPGIDLCYYASAFPRRDAVMASHDHSINQFAGWFGSDGFTAAYLGDDKLYGRCYQLRRGVTDKRIEKVKALCTELGWSYEGLCPILKGMDELDDLLESLV